jgi:hypothetical protein
MSGVHGVILAAQPGEIRVEVATISGGVGTKVGLSSAGSAEPGTFKTFVVFRIASDSGDYDLSVTLLGAASTDLTSVIVETAPGVYTTYLTSAATFVAGTWEWGTGSAVAWDNADTGATRRVRLA